MSKELDPEIQINITKIKNKSILYFEKAIMIFKKSFQKHLKDNCPGIKPPIDPFFTLQNLLLNTEDEELIGKAKGIFFILRDDPLFGNEIFESQEKLGQDLIPASSSSDEDELNSNSSGELEKRYHEANSEDSDVSESESKFSSDSENTSGKGVVAADRQARIQEWLFSQGLPTFKKEESIFQWLQNEEDLETFFRFIIEPFRSMIHIKV